MYSSPALKIPQATSGALSWKRGHEIRFYRKVKITLIISGIYVLQAGKGESLPEDAEPLRPDLYLASAGGWQAPIYCLNRPLHSLSFPLPGSI